MKLRFEIVLTLLLSFAFWQHAAYAERLYNAPQSGVAIRRDFSVTNAPAAFGSAGAAIFTNLSAKNHIACTNTSSADLQISLGTTTTNCSGGTANFFVPAAPTNGIGANGADVININTNVCVIGATGAVATGVLNCVVW